ncbi:mitochondrial nicotinamide adenine dinucleotide transporter SLC25A51 [Athalia rosae]|uniref:mitochondrial nicotinamide adenine dinucleotide transporter SLC25A51 n=1 Tax=Athalia rosae TaxID=37344 RepID=UPI0020332FD3|nr:mitochondrial nicotinamide adenine dinucleotide transporter SLC25A51 [Athalia rosae]XP_012257288.2 mitochondrial nicotinamide adenine dinucleotide transporter SLC25A51 [Athalia rosae]XP_012257289.2 mitochondrial nicotinamide adenine dinucleotide transporter SLC25A51 [Athalia rosae]
MGPEANLESLLYPKISASTPASSIINKSQDPNCKTGLKLTSSDAREFICGWGAAVINVTVTYPINKIIFRQILEGVPVGTAVKQLSSEGLRLLYRGILPPLCQKTLSLSIMFGVYEGSRKRLCLLTNNEIVAKFFAANIAGSAEAVLMPLERVQTLLQDWRYHDKFKNTSHAFRHLLNHHGISECYRGLVPILFRNGLSNVMFFSLRDRSKLIIADHDTLLYNFISGALIGGFTSTVFYPMNVIKIHMQTKIGGNFEKFWIVVREIYISRDKSIAHFYKGVHLNYMRSFISWGVINAAYDFLKKIILV